MILSLTFLWRVSSNIPFLPPPALHMTHGLTSARWITFSPSAGMQIPPHGKKFKNNCKLIRCVSIRARGRILDEGRAHTVDEGAHMFPLIS